MWVDSGGRVYMAEPADWRQLVELSADDYGRLYRSEPAHVHDVLDSVEDDLFREIELREVDPTEEEDFIDKLPPPLALNLTESPTTVPSAVRETLRRQPLRWRIDYIWALKDCL